MKTVAPIVLIQKCGLLKIEIFYFMLLKSVYVVLQYTLNKGNTYLIFCTAVVTVVYHQVVAN